MMSTHKHSDPMDPARPLARPMRGRLATGLWVAGLLGLFVALLYYRLLFTNRVLASGDILHYFYPYRDYAAETLRSGHIPLWNPYIFLGAPFLANPQSAVLYPLHWPLIWLPVTKQIYWSAALHTWLLGLGSYFLLRHWGASLWAGLVAALVASGSGFYGGLVGHINQMNAAAWLPWSVLVLELAQASCTNRLPSPASAAGQPRVRWWPPRSALPRLSLLGVCLGLLVALMITAGHLQTAYINLVGLGLWAIWPLAAPPRGRPTYQRVAGALPLLLVYGLGVTLGALIGAAQIVPSLELTRLGLRSGGLTYGEVTSFSLKPLHLPWTLLPTYGLADLSVVFDTLGYTEYVAYVGLLGLFFAVIGGWRTHGRPRQFGLLFVAIGFLLALGRWNPVSYLLYWIVPGFDLFRAPARWMMLYTLGAAVLAGLGVDVVRRQWLPRASTLKLRPRVQAGIVVGLAVLLALELIGAARSLPHTQPTAEQAVVDMRSAPAHLLTDAQRSTLAPGAAGRFLSMSAITFDPGDMADYRRIYREEQPPQLDSRAFDQLIVALKSQEILAPNLSLLWRVPAVDGFDGGALPLRRYLELLSLFVPPDELVPDGRLREQIHEMPDGDLLSLLNVQYVITDKVRDLWFEDVYYDRQIGARLGASTGYSVTVEAPQPFAATHIHLIGAVAGDDAALRSLHERNRPVAQVRVEADGAVTDRFELVAGGQPGAQLADDGLDSSMAARGGATVAYRDVEADRQQYRVQLALAAPTAPDAITFERVDNGVDVVIQAVTLYDARTGMFAALLPSDRGRFRLVHSGDVKVYEHLDVLPRAYLVHDVTGVTSPEQALALLHAGVASSTRAVVEGIPSSRENVTQPGQARIVRYDPERVEVQTDSPAPALLVLSDTIYPGWTATVDGMPAEIHPTNLLLRGVAVPAGEHTVVMRFDPGSWRFGQGVSLVGIVLSAGILLWWVSLRIRASRERAV